MKAALIWPVLVLMAAASARADEKPVLLTEAPGRKPVEGNCGPCHSLDYLRTNLRFLDRQGWQAEINKMTNVFGAPIAPEDAKAIVDYLTKYYGIDG